MPRAKAAAKKGRVARRRAVAAPVSAGKRARIRMYRLGVGDCFLLRLARRDGQDPPYTMLIDCGVHQSQKGGSDRVRQVAQDIHDETKGKLDVVVGTHEHWDHISGFVQAKEIFGTIAADRVWMAWTEDDKDPLARKLGLKQKRRIALAAVAAADARFRLSMGGREDSPLEGLLGFFGDGAGKKLAEAGKHMLAMSGKDPFYHKPGQAPIELPGVDARIFVLGPPRDEALIAKDAPSKADSEVYPFGTYLPAAERLEATLADVATPFDARFALPLEATRGIAFFAEHYWAPAGTAPAAQPREDVTQGWRRIDTAWLDTATTLALNLDSDTNNTSLVLAIELGPPDRDGDVLLFAADAQVGNWLGWQHLTWDYFGRRISGSDLLRRTVLYKVGHHASHNATLRQLGLETMEALELALVPTDAEMARKVGWGTLPWPALLQRLEEKAKTGVLRTDKPVPARLKKANLTAEDLFYEVEV